MGLFSNPKRLMLSKVIIDKADMMILEHCKDKIISASRLDKLLGMSKKTRIEHTKNLNKRGFIRLEYGKGEDHRSKYVSITKKGVVLYNLLKDE